MVKLGRLTADSSHELC